jgi:hypothetical protein
MQEPTSRTDKKGYIYVADVTCEYNNYLLKQSNPHNNYNSADISTSGSDMFVKIGRTDDVPRRVRQWNCKCQSKTYEIYFARKTAFQMRLERLLLLIVGDMEEHRAYRLCGFPEVQPPQRSGTSKAKEICATCELYGRSIFTIN